jgi:antirestriction protein ArdC
MPSTAQYEAITGAIIAALEEGTVPWQRPWNGKVGMASFPHNGATGNAYRGLNPWTLWAVAARKGYQSDAWLTFKQARALGGFVLKGEKGTLVYFWKFDLQKDEDVEPGEKPKTIPFMKTYVVFNVEQTQGVKLPKREFVETPLEWAPFEAAEAVLDGYVSASGITFGNRGGASAYYIPSYDEVQMPERCQFKGGDAYYSTAFHELAHSTGHPSRLGRFDLTAKLPSFGSANYSFEELVAEFSAAFLSASVGIDSTRDNSVAYIKGWLSVLKGDPKIAVQAAGKAQRAADLITKSASLVEQAA